MNSIDLELHSVIDLKKIIVLNEYLYPYINENDKEPSWDGSIILYNKKGKQKKDIEGRSFVQVKGKFNTNFSAQTIKYPVEVTDLKNYLADGGVIYFVIYVNRFGETQIYYVTLEPLKIKAYLHDIKKSQIKKTIQLKSFPKNQDKIVGIINNFQKNCKKQVSFSDTNLLTISDLEKKFPNKNYEILFSGVGIKNSDEMFEFADLDEVYMYAKLSDYEIPVPLAGKLTEFFSFEKDDLVISGSGKIFYKEVIRQYRKNKIVLCLGNNLSMSIEKESEVFRIEYTMSKSVREVAHNLEFMISLIENKGFYIDKNWLDLEKANFDFSSFDLKNEKKRLKYFKDIVYILDYFGIEGDLDLSTLKENERRDLDMLRLAFIENKTVGPLQENVPPFVVLKIGDFKLALIFKQINVAKDRYKIIDHFQNSLTAMAIDEKGNERKTSIYSPLTVEALTIVDNIKMDVFLQSYQELELSESIVHDANAFMLKIIEASDSLKESNKYRALMLMNTALDFASWIINIDIGNKFIDDEMKKLNLYQIKKRLGIIEKKELIELFKISENTDLSNIVRFGAHVLLDNKLGAELQYDCMSENEQNSIKEYPIYHGSESIVETVFARDFLC